MNGKELLIDGIEKIGLEISEEQANQFMKYYEMLIELIRLWILQQLQN